MFNLSSIQILCKGKNHKNDWLMIYKILPEFFHKDNYHLTSIFKTITLIKKPDERSWRKDKNLIFLKQKSQPKVSKKKRSIAKILNYLIFTTNTTFRYWQ